MRVEPPATEPTRHILICGGGLAAAMTVASLARQLARDTRITFVDTGSPASDLFYGTVTAPSAYAFNLAAGVEEPAVVLRSDTGFSWGTRYTQWGGRRSWTQCFALPFPIVDGVVFHQYLAAAGIDGIEAYLIAARAAQRAAFAHPPRGPGATGQHPLARADYGYQIDPASYAGLFVAAIPPERVDRVHGDLAEVETGAGGIAGIRLRDGRLFTADLYVDCTGSDAALLGRLVAPVDGAWRIGIATSDTDGAAQPQLPLRTVAATRHGWRSDTPLRDRVLHACAYHPSQADEAAAALPHAPDRTAEATAGQREAAWSANCVAIGHAAGVIVPHTPAPMMLLERDIDRLLTLIPDTGDMAVERREYNRRFCDDFSHAALFDRALVEAGDVPDARYWQAARATPVPAKLRHKIEMFERRGLLVAYDLEPFHPEDWTILHLGMGRRPARHDRLADRADRTHIEQYLATMQRDIDRVVASMPECATYRAQLETYLERSRA